MWVSGRIEFFLIKKKKVFFPLGYYVACKDLSFLTRYPTGPAEKALSPKTLVLCLVTQSCLTLSPHGLQPARLLCPWGFSRQEYWSGLPYPPPGDLPNLGIEPRSTALQADSLLSEPQGSPKNSHSSFTIRRNLV